MTKYSCGCVIHWSIGRPPSKCPVHWLQEKIRAGDTELLDELMRARPRYADHPHRRPQPDFRVDE